MLLGIGWLLVSSRHTNTPSNTQVSNSQPTQPAGDYHDNIYLSRTASTSSEYMTDFAGATLYTSSEDSVGSSNCTGACAKEWPPYTSGAVAQKQFPAGISVIMRSDGTSQFAWQGKPLYYYSKDMGPGDIKGDGTSGVWSIVKL